MYVKKITISIILIFIITSLAHSQSHIFKGHIVKNDNSKIEGFVRFSGNKNSLRFVEFNTEKEGVFEKYEPNEILEYGIGDYKLYRSKLKIGDQTRFLEVLIEDANSTLYFDKESKDNPFYLEDINNGLNQISGSRKRVKGILMLYYSDNNKLSEEIDQTKFNKGGLVRLAKLHYDNTGSDFDLYNVKAPYKSTYFIASIGIQSSSLNMNYYPDEALSLSSPTSFLFGFSYNTNISGLRYNLYANVGLSFATNEYTYSYTGEGGGIQFLGTRQINNHTLNYSYKEIMMRLPATIQYRPFALSKFTPVLSVGLSNKFSFSTNNEVDLEVFYNDDPVETINKEDSFMDLYNMGFLAGGGFAFKVSNSWIQLLYEYEYVPKDKSSYRFNGNMIQLGYMF